jgi:hypothetical protein
MRRAPAAALVTIGLAGSILTACGDDSPATSESSVVTPASASTTSGQDGDVIDPGDGGVYAVEIDPANFTDVVDNPFLPYRPGTQWVYEERSPDGEVQVVTIEVLDETRTVMGVDTVVVHDQVTNEVGDLVENTFDWYAQDTDGNVWYFGEDTTSYDEDGTISHDGAWEAGIDGALPGIVMPGSPTPSDTGYRQEYRQGVAEDMGQIIDVASGVVVTRDWTPLEPDVIEEKTYLTGVGFVHEIQTEGDGAGTTATLTDYHSTVAVP